MFSQHSVTTVNPSLSNSQETRVLGIFVRLHFRCSTLYAAMPCSGYTNTPGGTSRNYGHCRGGALEKFYAVYIGSGKQSKWWEGGTSRHFSSNQAYQTGMECRHESANI